MFAHRQDIDGLRALAVVPVVAFHLGAKPLGGGFTGVDVFFVISGFLITTILRADLDAGRFSLLAFYKRRVLRIFPALLVMVVATLAAATWRLAPNEIRDVARSALAAVGFLSNIHFYLSSGYFAANAADAPLLHTWSLGVEEQFYVVFPVLLWAVHRLARRRLAMAVGLAGVMSFLFGLYALRRDADFAFYMLPARFWELALGAWIALGAVPNVTRPRARSLLAGLGVALMLGGYLGIRASAGFPGWQALIPCLGAALVILYAPATPVGGALSLAPIAYLGRISYSLYLWHWPVIVVYRMPWMERISAADRWVMIPLAFVLAVASYHLVESPFRTARARARPSGVIVLRGLGASALAAAVIGLVFLNADRLTRLTPDMLRIAGYSDYGRRAAPPTAAPQRTACYLNTTVRTLDGYDAAACLALDPTRPNYLLIGDSHAAHVASALAEVYPQVNFLIAVATGCRPLLPPDGPARCRELYTYLTERFLPGRTLDGIIVAGRWSDEDVPRIAATLDALRPSARDLVLFGPIVEYRRPLPYLIVAGMQQGAPVDARQRLDRPFQVDRALAAIAPVAGARHVPILDLICPGGVCTTLTEAGEPMQFDYGHLTDGGAKVLVRRMAAVLDLPPRQTTAAPAQ